MLKNRLILLSLLFAQWSVYAQLVEAESRPYQFNIDMMMEIENQSISRDFYVLPYKVQISDLLEAELAKWYHQNQKLIEVTDSMDKIVVGKIDEYLPSAIQVVGTRAMEKSEPHSFFIEKSLQFEIQMNNFKAFKISIPLAEVESFKNNFDNIQYSEQLIDLNDEYQFVVTYLKLYNPENSKRYVFYNTEDESIQAPSFSISLPNAKF